MHTLFRSLFGSASEFQSSKEARVLSDPGLRAVHLNRRPILGLLLAQP
jgi:hypothetical protein